MMTTVKGVYRNGKIELTENPGLAADGSPVIVTFLPASVADVQADSASEDPTIELLRQWRAEDAADDSSESADREESLDEFLANLRANRLKLRTPRV